MATTGETADLLLADLRRQVARPDLSYLRPPEALTGGFFAEMLRFELVDPPPLLAGPLVARIVPQPDQGRWEAAVQAHVGAAAPGLSPRVRLTLDERGALGRFVLVMDLVDGHPPLSGLSPGQMLVHGFSVVRSLPGVLGGITAELHAVDPEPLRSELRRLDPGHAQDPEAMVVQRRDEAHEQGADELVAVAERLLAEPPVTEVVVVCHGDLHPFNVLVGEGPPTLVDWTVSLVAHPTFDLGFTELLLANAPVPLPGPVVRGARPVLRRMADRFLADYRRRSPLPAAELDGPVLVWHRRLHALRILVELDRSRQEDPIATADHPWTLMEPTVRAELQLQPRP